MDYCTTRSERLVCSRLMDIANPANQGNLRNKIVSINDVEFGCPRSPVRNRCMAPISLQNLKRNGVYHTYQRDQSVHFTAPKQVWPGHTASSGHPAIVSPQRDRPTSTFRPTTTQRCTTPAPYLVRFAGPRRVHVDVHVRGSGCIIPERQGSTLVKNLRDLRHVLQGARKIGRRGERA